MTEAHKDKLEISTLFHSPSQQISKAQVFLCLQSSRRLIYQARLGQAQAQAQGEAAAEAVERHRTLTVRTETEAELPGDPGSWWDAARNIDSLQV